MNIIEVRDLVKSYHNKEVLKKLNLTIKKGEKIAILGANGAGKTTLISIISQSIGKTSGEVNINIQGNLKSEIGIQFQEGNWPPGITAKNILNFYKSFLKRFDDAREQELYEIFEIKEFEKRPLVKLSGGQKQRFNAMLAILNDPQIVILDELTTGLDMRLQFKIEEYIKKVFSATKKTLIIVSHNPQEVQDLCERLVIINEGVVWYDNKVENVIKEFGSVKQLMNLFFDGGLKNEINN